MHVAKKALLFLGLILAQQFAHAQSTSTWILVKKSDVASGAIGASYVSIGLLAASVYQDSNWWTRLIEKNRTAMATVEVSGSYPGGRAIADRRVSPAIQIQRDKKNIEFGWSQTLVRDMPVSFTSLHVNVGIAKTATDGVDQLIGAASELSKKVPALAVSDTTLGTVSAAKLLVDFIFDKGLAVSKLQSAGSLTAPAGETLAPGVYAVLAGNSADEYERYLIASSDGKSLEWNGNSLVHNGNRVSGITYFVVQVGYKERMFDATKLPDAALTSEANWAKLYRAAIGEAQQLRDTKTFNEKVTKIGQIKADADHLLNEDLTFVHAERSAIQAKVTERLNTLIKARHEAIAKDGDGLVPFANMPKVPNQWVIS